MIVNIKKDIEIIFNPNVSYEFKQVLTEGEHDLDAAYVAFIEKFYPEAIGAAEVVAEDVKNEVDPNPEAPVVNPVPEVEVTTEAQPVDENGNLIPVPEVPSDPTQVTE